MSDSHSSTASAPRASKDDERILVVPTRRFRELGYFQGFSQEAIAIEGDLFANDQTRFMRRGDAERDPEFKQLIPYILFVCSDDPERETPDSLRVFAYLRGKGQGEARLRSKWSVGIGGHINDGDLTLDDGAVSSVLGRPRDLFEAGAAREIAEEVAIDSPVLSFKKVALVNDDSTEVGRVHLGVVCVVKLARPELRSNEPDLLEARFRRVDELLEECAARPEQFESWTTLALQGLFGEPDLNKGGRL